MADLVVTDETILAAKLAMEAKGFNYTGADGKKSLAAVIKRNPVFVAAAINGVQRRNRKCAWPFGTTKNRVQSPPKEKILSIAK